ncbi:MAG TPA: DUF58 domain-containing protein [Gaiellaceae bacterium]|nr:DUF58 domain-containing protein [Gaiellaceae bacterium]
MSGSLAGLSPPRSPARPGPGPVPERLLRALAAAVRRRVEGLLPGEARAAAIGVGSELAQVRPYLAGDDVRAIDWNVTARTGEPHVRVHVAERALVAWLVLDVSPSMSFGTADRRKADVAEGVALALGYLATRRGNRLGVVTFGGSHPALLPPRRGREALLTALLTLRTAPDEEGTGVTPLGPALARAAAAARRRGLVAIVSDFRGPDGWDGPLRDLAARHEVLAVEVRDPREQALPDVGPLSLVDPETGRRLRVDTRSRALRERFAAAAAAERDELARRLRRVGVDHVTLSTRGDWLRTLVGALRARGGRR